MKKMKVLCTALLVISAAVFVVFQGYLRVIQDKTPPVIICPGEEITASVAVTEEELMDGVQAEDNRSGDVSNTLVIEDLSAFTKDGERMITYAAVDESMNVGRFERTLIYADYQEPVFKMSDSLCFSKGENVDVLSRISAESVLDGSLSSNIKYSLENTVNASVPGSYPIQFRVMDSCGKTVYLDTYIEILEADASMIEVKLKDYLVYIKKGAGFDPNTYYAGSDVEGNLMITSNVDTKKEGTYYADYTVSTNGVSGKSRLIVIVQ